MSRHACLVGELHAELAIERVDHDDLRVADRGQIDGLTRVDAAQVDQSLQLKERQRHVFAHLSDELGTTKEM